MIKVLKKKIPIVGICYGMQLLAKFFRMKIKKKRHLGNHKIFYFENRDKKIKVVNSFHNYVITKLNKNFTPIAYSVDGTIECFLDKKKKILGFMWHPERKKNIIKLESRLFKTICN